MSPWLGVYIAGAFVVFVAEAAGNQRANADERYSDVWPLPGMVLYALIWPVLLFLVVIAALGESL